MKFLKLEILISLDILKERGDQHFKDWIQSEFGVWPLLSNETWDDSSVDLTEIIPKAALAGSYVLVAFQTSSNLKNSSSRILLVSYHGYMCNNC